MAEEATVELGTDVTIDMAVHQGTYMGFVGLVKYATAAIAITLLLLAFFLI